MLNNIESELRKSKVDLDTSHALFDGTLENNGKDLDRRVAEALDPNSDMDDSLRFGLVCALMLADNQDIDNLIQESNSGLYELFRIRKTKEIEEFTKQGEDVPVYISAALNSAMNNNSKIFIYRPEYFTLDQITIYTNNFHTTVQKFYFSSSAKKKYPIVVQYIEFLEEVKRKLRKRDVSILEGYESYAANLLLSNVHDKRTPFKPEFVFKVSDKARVWHSYMEQRIRYRITLRYKPGNAQLLMGPGDLATAIGWTADRLVDFADGNGVKVENRNDKIIAVDLVTLAIPLNREGLYDKVGIIAGMFQNRAKRPLPTKYVQ